MLNVKKLVSRGDGELAIKDFLNKRVYSKDQSIRDTISKNSRIDFLNDLLSKPNGKKEKANRTEKEDLISIFNLIEKCQALDMTELFNSRVTAECLGVFNPDGSMRKTQKNKNT